MEVTDKTFLNNKDVIESTNYVDLLSDELMINLFSFLTTKELLNSSLVCKNWECLAADKNLWKLFTKNLELCIPEDFNYRECIGNTMNELYKTHIKYIEALKEQVKTAEEMGDMYLRKLASKNNNNYTADEKEKISMDYENENSKKSLNLDNINLGCKSSLLLYKIGLCSLELAENFAKDMIEKSGSKAGWLKICKVLIEEKNFEKANQYLIDYIEEPDDTSMNKLRAYLSEDIIDEYLINGKLEDAFSEYKKHFTNRDIKYPESKYNIEYKLKDYAIKYNRLDVFEEMIDTSMCGIFKIYMIETLLRIHIDNIDYNKINEILIKYRVELNESVIDDSSILIEANSVIGNFDFVWNFINKNSDSDETYMFYLCEFQDVLLNINNISELEKVNFLIEKENQKNDSELC